LTPNDVEPAREKLPEAVPPWKTPAIADTPPVLRVPDVENVFAFKRVPPRRMTFTRTRPSAHLAFQVN
jgi:hypothetical protein